VAGGLIYYLGAKNGEIYTILPTEDSPIMETSQARLSAVTANSRMPVLDIASESLWFYLLTAEGVFRTAQSGRERIELVYPCTDVQNITYTEGGIVLWSKNQVAPLVLVSLNGGGNAVELYTPVLPLTSITAHNNKLVIVEAMDRVTIFDLTEKKSVFSYNGTGFQDAILLDDNSLYISRSAGIGSSSIITINITTSETVMLPVESNIAFALTEMPGQSIGTQFFGFLVSVSGTSQKTELYDFNTRTARYKPIAVWADEDLNAFVYPTDRYIYTNLGKANVMIIDRRNGRQYRMARAAALPRKLMASRQSLLVLNTDGSLSWYRRGNNTHAGDWFLDMENNWVSY
jgi:hypothetical protein